MKDALLGRTGARLPLVGQGTWRMEHDERSEVARALRAGSDAGLTHRDTAELHGSGRAEEIVGEAIAGRRDEVFLVSRVMPSNATRAGTVAACERSLRRLKGPRCGVPSVSDAPRGRPDPRPRGSREG